MYIPFDEKEWPDSWKIVEFKEYPRLLKIPLPEPSGLDGELREILIKRRSIRNFDSNASISSDKLSSLLFWSAGISRNKQDPEKSFRFYPSGGARYSLEIYFYFRGNDQIPPGLYHYNVKNHYLEKILGEEVKREIVSLPTYTFARDAALFFFVTGIFDRHMRKYRERGYRFGLIEQGLLLENFYLVSAALDLGCCGIGSIFDTEIENILDINPPDEAFIGSFVVGPTKT